MPKHRGSRKPQDGRKAPPRCTLAPLPSTAVLGTLKALGGASQRRSGYAVTNTRQGVPGRNHPLARVLSKTLSYKKKKKGRKNLKKNLKQKGTVQKESLCQEENLKRNLS